MASSVEILLREHSREELPSDFPISQFNSYLDEVWASRLLFAEEDFGEEPVEHEPSTKQPFFHFTYLKEIKARNYVGFVNWQGHIIEVVPKVFAKAEIDKINIWNHLVYWLSYCRRIIFPFSAITAYPDASKSLPEALIYAFARFTNDILVNNPYSCYEEVVEVGQVLKGRLDVNSYLNEQYAKGNPHVLVMNHEPFVYDNLLNRILKYVASSLNQLCKSNDSYYELQRILFQLEEVSEFKYLATDCDRVKLNRLHSDYGIILDMCRFFLAESYLSREATNFQNLSFLIPMDYVFEDFIAGFLNRNFSDRYRVNYQAHNWLTDQKVFQIRHDILLTNRQTGQKIILDTKYKLRDIHKDSKKGISQVDMYQMVSYALRANCSTVLLLYPYHATSTWQPDEFTVSSHMIPDNSIRIIAAEVPIVFDDLKEADHNLEERLRYLLDVVENQPKIEIEEETITFP